MDLRLTGLKAQGLRCAELDLTLGRETTPRFTFLQMPNGTGKTTLADCLRAALSGEASTWGPERIQQLRRRDSDTDDGLFEARFSYDNKAIAVGIQFDFAEGTCRYYTTLQPRGRKPKHDLPGPLARFADPNFVRLYVFNVELPQDLLRPASDRASQAIDAFYQLYVLGQISDGLERYFNDEVQRAGGAGTQQGLTRLQNRLSALTQRRLVLREDLSKKSRDLSDLRTEINEKSQELEQRLADIGRYRERRQKAEEELREAEAALSAGIVDEIARLQRPLDAYPAARSALDRLGEALDSLRLPESTSRQFFLELTRQEFCVCGRPMDEAAQAAVLSTADTLLQDETAGVINAFKNDVRSFARESAANQPATAATKLVQLMASRDTAETRLAQLRDETSAEADETAQALNSDLQQLKSREQGLELAVDDLEREPHPDDDDNCRCIKYFDREIDREGQRLAKLTQTVELRDRKTRLQRVLEETATSAASAAREELVAATNDRLDILLPGEDVRLAAIDPSLRLENREGLNLGAMLSVGYAFLTTLFERGNHQFPFVVDAPAMGLDGLARRALAGILPKVTHQFVGFVLDNETDFVTAVQDEVPSECAFYTIFSNTSRNRPLAEQLDPSVEPGPGGTYVIEGYDFFSAVQWKEVDDDA